MDADELLKKAVESLREGQLEGAMTFCNLALAKNPDSPGGWNTKASVFMAANQFREAIECFEHAQQVGGNPSAAQGIAICRQALGEPAAPAQPAQDTSGPTLSATAWFYKGEEMDKQGQSAEALSCFEKALAIDPHAAYTWYGKGVALGKLGRPEDELACYEKALALNASFPEAWFNKAISLGNARRFREALECFEKAQQLGYPDAAQGVAYCQRVIAEESRQR